jgi:hypothetical protein
VEASAKIARSLDGDEMIGLCQVWRLRRRAPCKGSSLSCLARLASIRTWRNARRAGCADLP